MIDELIMYGTPIQPETERFALSPLFGKVFNFYSTEDVVQRADWVSSKQKLSSQRMHRAYMACMQRGIKKLYQARIMIDHDLVSEKYFKGCVLRHKNKRGITSFAETNLIQDLLAGVNVFKRLSKDPTHKALWFFLCKQEALDTPTPLGYLPVMILTPLLLKALETSGLNDIDLNIKNDERNLHVQYTPHDHAVIRGVVTMPMQVIDQIKQGTKLWSEFDVSLADEFSVMYQHLKA